MEGLELTFKTITPVFLAGADQRKAELRAQSIKGVLRFWYRAIDPAYEQREPQLFGGTDEGEGQAKFLLRLPVQLNEFQLWSKERYVPREGGRNRRTGVVYFGYPLETGSEANRNHQQRSFLPPGRTFKVQVLFRKRLSAEERRGLLAAFWLLGHVGGLGSRARRGFGTVALQSWRGMDGDFAELEELSIAHGARSAETWRTAFSTGLQAIKAWFPGNPGPDHLVIDDQAAFFLSRQGQPRTGDFQPWENALNEAGLLMQSFRQRYKNCTLDYADVKSHMVATDESTAMLNPDVPRRIMANAPLRAAFGLPLTFRYSSLEEADRQHNRGGRSITFQGADHDRSASRVWVRIIEIGDRCHPFCAFLTAPLLPDGEMVSDGQGHELELPSAQALDEFKELVREQAVPEVGR